MKPKPNKHVTTIKCVKCGELLVKIFPWCPPMEFKLAGIDGKQLCKRCLPKLPKGFGELSDYPSLREMTKGYALGRAWRTHS